MDFLKRSYMLNAMHSSLLYFNFDSSLGVISSYHTIMHMLLTIENNIFESSISIAASHGILAYFDFYNMIRRVIQEK